MPLRTELNRRRVQGRSRECPGARDISFRSLRRGMGGSLSMPQRTLGRRPPHT